MNGPYREPGESTPDPTPKPAKAPKEIILRTTTAENMKLGQTLFTFGNELAIAADNTLWVAKKTVIEINPHEERRGQLELKRVEGGVEAIFRWWHQTPLIKPQSINRDEHLPVVAFSMQPAREYRS